MGIDVHSLNFLRYAARKGTLGRVATIGRQWLLIPPARLAEMLGLSVAAEFGMFSEELLIRHLGATLVDSFDCSDYEGATFIVEMNKPLEPIREYDTVIDCGCVEHIYDVPRALANISLLCAKGGQILHVVPGNNFCGHGFWQVSPELFFSLYSEAHGYSETEVFLADLTNPRHWFEVERPMNGRRAEVVSRTPLYVMCRTRKISVVKHENVQQSDYVHAWQRHESQKTGHENETIKEVKSLIRKRPKLLRAIQSARYKIRAIMTPTYLSNLNPHLTRHDVSRLLTA